MLVTFLYHSIKDPSLFEKHLAHLVENYPMVIPGAPLSLLKTQICISFDDGYKDFYTVVYPLLRKWKIPAVLAVPIDWVGKPAYCNWEELQEMDHSGLVHIASHSYSHKNLLENNVDLHREVVISKQILEDKLQKSIDTFVYPYGKFNTYIHSEVKKHYTYIMRIGSAINFSWDSHSKMIYRIPNDDFSRKEKSLFYYYSWLWNSLRNR
jgi:peptidoglycan/xylan/chitin deacetylase (PgdA/CDA1 family)